MYILGTDCQWAALPKDLVPRSTAHDYHTRWNWDGRTKHLLQHFTLLPMV